jgi:CheY-like chemotaxis protein
MEPRSSGSSNFNLERASVMLIDGDAMGASITSQVLAGFGARHVQKAGSVEDAKRLLGIGAIDLILMDPATMGEGGYEFVPWIRRNLSAPNRYAPVLVTTGHTQISRIASVRDSGANFVVLKPFSPAVLMARLQWLSRDRRPYVDCPVYAGPDRRWKFDGPPVGSNGRRSEDATLEVQAASQPNLSQAAIDAMMAPRKVSL